MRISDWSSDVCSSNLHHLVHVEIGQNLRADAVIAQFIHVLRAAAVGLQDSAELPRPGPVDDHDDAGALFGDQAHRLLKQRSEEQTSELQSLMRISYAVFCLKKKKRKTI